MKTLVLLTCLLVITLSNAASVAHPRGCIYIRGRCGGAEYYSRRVCEISTKSGSNIKDRKKKILVGTGSRECPVGTHSYSIGCDYLTPEATCSNPHPEKENKETGNRMCDVSKCYCDPPTVRDRASGNCIAFEDCPKNK